MTDVIHVDLPFRVEAGPGAGKTHWLAGHVRRTLETGTRLNGRTSIACITYTQIGADAFAARLGSESDRVSISTIHSFLYRQLVRPYAHLLKMHGLNTAALDGHGPLRTRTTAAKAWLADLNVSEGQWHRPEMRGPLSDNLQNALAWTLRDASPAEHLSNAVGPSQADHERRWRLGFGRGANWRGITYPPSNVAAFYGGREDLLLAYRKSYWKDGHIGHDDVIYLAMFTTSSTRLRRTRREMRQTDQNY